MITWELATAYCGALLHINPFDQPNVQAAKDYVVAALDGYVATGELESVAAGDLSEALRGAERGPLVPRDPGLRDADGRQRGARCRRCAGSCATRSAWPPSSASARATCTPRASCTRAARGRASTCRCWRARAPTPPIPGRPYGFRTVIEAQSRGDAQALRATGQPVARVDLADVATTVRAALGAA